MSRDTVVAKRYAKALFEVASQEKVTLEVEQDLKALVEVIQGNDEIERFLTTPNISDSDKLNALNRALQGKLSQAVINTVELLVRRRRTDIFPDLLDSYVKLKGESLGMADAVVYSTYPLDEREKEAVAAEFGQVAHKVIRVNNMVDKSLLGGLKVVIGDTLYDGSLSGKLARLEKSFNDKHSR
ncbi:F0F1 ATP synthase subunit delta [Paenibacillus crassostreae]|uniref:ATP synthase subunit delta n=1 Tax=Paenibacillus crassostreae TaxID=1763538 RepID=A0A167B3D2_9BACL|nr:F0F1 ATP synthase subunit delta [Paenibacillus crassostreae]AOZ93205.1 ATP synthase F1 subunit delta [Paenibacillus crassostreae]OAB71704.1 ATP synthase F0F1 subunit delta [Paenibacillus crassostreae]